MICKNNPSEFSLFSVFKGLDRPSHRHYVAFVPSNVAKGDPVDGSPPPPLSARKALISVGRGSLFFIALCLHIRQRKVTWKLFALMKK